MNNSRSRRAALFAAAISLVSMQAAVASAPAAVPLPAASGARATKYLTPEAAKKQAESVITQEQMRRYLTFIASDALEGRNTPSAGLDAAAEFIKFNLTRFGLKPAGDDGTYFQKIALRQVKPNADKSAASFANGGKASPLQYGVDFVPTTTFRRSGDGSAAASPLIFAGAGWVIPSRQLDPYKGIDVKDAIIVVAGQMRTRFRPGDGGADAPVSPADYARTHGARGVVYVSLGDRDFGAAVAQASSTRGEITPEDPEVSGRGAAPAGGVPSIVLSADAAEKLFAGEPALASAGADPLEALGNGNVPSFRLAASKQLSFTAAYDSNRIWTQNVVATLEGSDPALKGEYVAFGAHYDHLGVATRPGPNGDTIYNGADDDGSGTTALLALSEAFATSPERPKRSLLFVWHCGEEKGLWGSAYFTSHPTIPLTQIATQLNIDMIGRTKFPGDTEPRNATLSGPDEVYIIGSHLMSSSLGDLSDKVNANYLNLKMNTHYDDPTDPERLFYRSDHFNYAKHGVPIIFYFDGVHVDYHQLGDEVQKIDFLKMQKIVRTIFLTATNIADLPVRPVVDKTLPFKIQ